MAHHDQPPIYKEALDLALCFEKTARTTGRYDDYALGADIGSLSRENPRSGAATPTWS
jgi:hypothetical protein